MTEKTLGQILIEKNIITPAILDLALLRQEREKGRYLGEILFEMGVPQDEIDKALDRFNKRKSIGQILIDLKIITPQQLGEALEKKKELSKKDIRKPVGRLLMELGYISYSEYLKALSKFFNMPSISLTKFIPTPPLQKTVGEKYAQKHLIVVLENSAKIVKLALAEPTVYLIEELRKALPAGKSIEFYLASASQIKSCLKGKIGSMTEDKRTS
jgi:hypothetical protein